MLTSEHGAVGDHDAFSGERGPEVQMDDVVGDSSAIPFLCLSSQRLIQDERADTRSSGVATGFDDTKNRFFSRKSDLFGGVSKPQGYSLIADALLVNS